MPTAVLMILLAVVVGGVLRTRQMRAAKLRRLATFVAPPGPDIRLTEVSLLRSPERFLPRGLVRDLRLLDIHLAWRNAAAAAVLLATVMAIMSAILGILGAVTAAAAVLITGRASLNILAARRVRELGTLLPNFFDRVRQLLVIGNSLPTAFARAVEGSQPRLIVYFAPALRRVANGAGFADAIRQSSDDIGLYEMDLFATAVSTNMRFGGSLTHALGNLVHFLRKRASVERELRASTSLIRTSAWVLGLLPVLVAALVVTQNQQYARWFVSDPLGKSLLVYCICSQILGAVVMKSIAGSEF